MRYPPRRAVLISALLLVVVLPSGCDESPRSAVDGRGPAGDGPAVLSDGGARLDRAVPPKDGAAQGDAAVSQPDAGQSCPGGYGGPPTTKDPPVAGTWKLEFQDDFAGPGLDDRKWKVGQNWAGANGKGSTDPKNISVSCGYAVFTVDKRENTFAGKTWDYATGELSTFKRFRQRYGYFEARIKYEGVRGLWPAFWLMPDRGKYGDLNKNRTSYLKFDLESLPSEPVKSAVLELNVEEGASGVQVVTLVKVVDDGWSEGSITGNNRPALDPLWIEMRYDPKWTGGQKAIFDVTDYVNEQLGGDKVVSLALIDGFNRARRVSFSSKEADNASHRPRLVIAGVSSPVIAAEDASVGEGTNAGKNMGGEAQLHVEEQWGNTSATHDGGMEFDIMESLAQWGPHKTSHAMHWDGYGSEHEKTGSGHIDIPPTADGFHVYGLHWQPGLAQFYIDGKQTFEWKNARVASVAEYIILSLQVGGWADKYGDNRAVDDAKLPATMTTDYVRVWSGSAN